MAKMRRHKFSAKRLSRSLRNKIDLAAEHYDLNYTLPGYCRRRVCPVVLSRWILREYGTIPGVTDKDYVYQLFSYSGEPIPSVFTTR